MCRLALALLLLTAVLPAKQPLLVVSVDGLDQRYLADRDRLGLKIPNIRKMIAAGAWAERGVLGVVPTITWPSHTTLITGVEPRVHRILSNRLPGGDYPWSAKLLGAKTLLDAAHEAGLKTAAVTWPVTVDAPLDYNLPEYFKRRRGGAMDLSSIESQCVPRDLVQEISRAVPSFAQEWMDDRTRTQAVVFLLREKKPDLLLVHLVDLDSEEHDNAPFSREANAILEYTDQLLGNMLEAMPAGMAAALVSDHGFERVDTTVNVNKLAAEKHVEGIAARGAIVSARDDRGAAFLEKLGTDPRYGIGRRIPAEEVARFAPDLTGQAAVFESATGFEFSGKSSDAEAHKPPGAAPTKGGTSADLAASGESVVRSSSEVFGKPREIGNHGHWPTRYRAVFLLVGPGISAAHLGELPMTQVAGRFAQVLNIPFTPAPR